jgi:hypothetical protein
LILHHEVDYGPSLRLALEGNMLSPESNVELGYLFRDYESKKDEFSYLVSQGTILVSLIKGFEKYGALKSGAHADVMAFHRMYETGALNQLIRGILQGEPTAAIQAVDTNSMDLVPDLNYEIALGIEPEPDPAPVEQKLAVIVHKSVTILPEEEPPRPSLSDVRVQDLTDMLSIIGYLRTYGSGEMAATMSAIYSEPYALGVHRKNKDVLLLVTGHKHGPEPDGEPNIGSPYAPPIYYRPASFDIPRKGHIDIRPKGCFVRDLGSLLLGPLHTTTLNGSVVHHPDYFGMSSLGHWAGG